VLRRAGDFEFLRELGRGGMGLVYEARQRGLNRRVAVKVLPSLLLSRPEARQRFQAEAEAAARLRHPNIVTVHQVGELDGEPCIVMELIAGPTLAELVREHPLAPRVAARYLRLVAEAIAHAHAEGVLHRDLKPANILLDDRDQPRVTDFGLARQLDTPSDLTRTGELLGSPGYLAPEQIRGESSGAPADLYALGAVLYQLLTARPPFVAESVAATLQQALQVEPVPPRRLNPAVPADLETICLKCLQKEPARRYASADDLAADLASFEAGRPIRARPVSAGERLWLWCRRKPALAALIAALALSVGTGLASVLWQWREARSSREAMRLNLYAADLSAASRAEREGDLGGARALLERHRPHGAAAEADLRGFEWRLLWQRCQGGELATLGTHPHTITCVAVSPDGRWAASGSQAAHDQPGQSLKLWDLAARRAVATLPQTGSVWSVAFTPDSRRLMSAGHEGISLWEVPSGVAVPDWAPLAGQMAALASRAPVLVASAWHPFGEPAKAPLVVLDLESDTRTSLPVGGWFPALSPDGRWLAFLDARYDVQLWDLRGPQHVRCLATNRNLYTLRFSPDGLRLAAAGRMMDARVWDLAAPGQPPRLFSHARNVWSAEFAPGGERLLTTASDQQLRLWDIATGAPAGELRGHVSEVWAAAFTPDGRCIVSGGKDQTLRLWSTAPGTNAILAAQAEMLTPLFSPDGRRLVTAARIDGAWRATVWQWQGHASRWHALPGNDSVAVPSAPLGFAADGREVLFLEREPPTLWPWNPDQPANTRRVPLATAGRPLALREAGASGDGRTLFVPDATGAILLWDTQTGAQRAALSHPALRAAAQERERFSPRLFSALAMDLAGRALAVGCYSDPALVLFDVASGKTQRLAGHRDRAAHLAFSPDGRTLASGGVDGLIQIWDVPSGERRGSLPGHLEEASGIAFTPDGRTLASVNLGLEMKLWHLPTLRELATLPLLNGGNRLAFASGGRHVAINTADTEVMVWEVAEGDEVGSPNSKVRATNAR
jgi:WD40 repeat protein/predicted Ser/Thr protein kinase